MMTRTELESNAGDAPEGNTLNKNEQVANKLETLLEQLADLTYEIDECLDEADGMAYDRASKYWLGYLRAMCDSESREFMTTPNDTLNELRDEGE